MGEIREQYYGVKGEPFGRDHLVLARSASTLCGKTIGANWLMARGIFTAKSFIGSPGACEACSDAVRPPARDGETLSEERRIDELLHEFQMACEDAASSSEDSIRASAKHRAILRNELRSELLAVAALRAQLAEARADKERLDWLSDRAYVEATDGGAEKVRVQYHRAYHKSLRKAIDAARASRDPNTGQTP